MHVVDAPAASDVTPWQSMGESPASGSVNTIELSETLPVLVTRYSYVITVPAAVKLEVLAVLSRPIPGSCTAGTVTVAAAVTTSPVAATVPVAVPVLGTLPRSMSAAVVV